MSLCKIPCTWVLFTVGVMFGCQHHPNPTKREICKVMVFAASSLSDLSEVIRQDFVSGHPDCQVAFNFGASNALGLQIESGAHADVFLSAAAGPVDHLLASGRVEASRKQVLFSNRLAIITNQANSIEVKDACSLKSFAFEHIAIGQPDAVPAGIYAKEYLSKLRCDDGASPWAALQGRLLPMSNVRAVLSVVELQPNLVGIVYQTDALGSRAVKTQFVVQGPDAPKIEYYGIRVGSKERRKFADLFLDQFSKPEVQAKVRRLGFVVDKS